MKISVLILICCVSGLMLQGQDESLPAVFQTGEHEEAYATIVKDHPAMLLTACDDSMDKAYLTWTGMLKEVEIALEQRDIDIRGVKMWVNAFWDKDGRLEHMVFYPKPHSKNINYDELEIALGEIVAGLMIDVQHETGISHYGSANFPIYNRNLLSEGN